MGNTPATPTGWIAISDAAEQMHMEYGVLDRLVRRRELPTRIILVTIGPSFNRSYAHKVKRRAIRTEDFENIKKEKSSE